MEPRKHKISQYEWLGAIPIDWIVAPLNSITTPVSIKNQPNENLLSLYRDYGVILKSSRDDNHNRAGSDLSKYKLVTQGDLVINKMKAWQGSVGISKYKGIISPAYIICKVREDINSRFLNYLLRCNYYKHQYGRLSYGVRTDQWDIRYDDFKKLPTLLPVPAEQTTIANFLDYKLAKIDRFIRKKKQLIKLLNEQKAAIINQAVTKGLDPNVKMKPSSIEWLGDVPEHWELKKLKYSVSLNSHRQLDNNENSNIKIALENIEGKTGKILELSENPFEGLGTIFKSGDVLFGKLRPYLAKVIAPSFEGSCVNEILVLTPNTDIWNSTFLKYRMLATDFISVVDNSTYGAKMPRASWSFIGSLKISRPPISEQIQIINSVESENKLIDEIIIKINKEIILSQEYKTSLIAEAVTGKIDVRDFVVPEVVEEETYEELEEELNMVAEDEGEYGNEDLEE
jgi:type I restriction enzyme S subunit